MADFKILDVFEKNWHMIVLVEHYQPDDSFWFTEHYIFSGVEGVKRKRTTNSDGECIMDNGEVAPTHKITSDRPYKPGISAQYLPEDRDWAREPAPHMTVDSILSTIRDTHRRRTESGWSVQKDSLPPLSKNAVNQDGVDVLISTFGSLKEYTE